MFITVARYWRYHLLNSILPVLMCGYLGFLVFFLDVRDIAARMEVGGLCTLRGWTVCLAGAGLTNSWGRLVKCLASGVSTFVGLSIGAEFDVGRVPLGAGCGHILRAYSAEHLPGLGFSFMHALLVT